ncbi:MAG: hypothetical protein JXA11_03450 [Phycisphaerae bacterium]|nr:hypothetical protein [Phycisphaerae bacterium]
MKPPRNTTSGFSRQPLLRALRATRYRLRLAELAAAVLLMLALGLAGSLAIIVADHTVPGGLNLWTRWTLRWILIGTEACLLIVMIAFPLLRRISNLYAARQMEKADPSFRNDLTAALQLRGETGPAAATAAAVRRSASRQATRMYNGAPLPKQGLRLAGLAMAAAAAAFFLYWIFAPKSTLLSLQRALGVGEPPVPTRTRLLSLTPPDETTVLTGDEVLFEARLRNPRGPVVLSIARDGHHVLDEDLLTMTPIDEPGPGEAFRVAWKARATDRWVTFRLVCGDAATRRRRMEVLPTPTLRRVRVRCEWPSYTRLPPRTTDGGRVEGPVDTRATVTAESNLPVKQASLVFASDGRTLGMTPDDTGQILSTTFRVTRPDQYVIHYELTDIEAEAESIAHEVVVTPDRPPTLRLDQPVGKTSVAEDESLGILGEVTDDFGAGQVDLVFTKAGESKILPLWRQPAPGATSRRVRANLPAQLLGRAGDTLTCVVEARDCNPSVSGGQTTRGEPFELTITPPKTPTDGEKEPDERKTESEENQTRTTETQSETGESASEGNDAKKLDQLCAAMREGKQGDSDQQQPSSDGKHENKDSSKPEDQEQGKSRASSGTKPPSESEKAKSDSESKPNDQTQKRDSSKEKDKPEKKDAPGNKSEKQPPPPKDSQPSERCGKDGCNKSKCDTSGGGSKDAAGKQSGKPAGGEKQDTGDRDEQNRKKDAGNNNKKSDSGKGNEPAKENQNKDQRDGPDGKKDAGENADSGKDGSRQADTPPTDTPSSPRGAVGPHDKQKDGEGTSEREGDLEAVQEDVLLPGSVEPLESVGRALDQARRRIEDDDVDPNLLETMNMTLPEFKGFVEKYSRQYKQALQDRRNGKRSVTVRSPSENAAVEKGGEGKLKNVSGESAVEKHRAIEDRRTSPTKVSPEYQKHLEAYLRAVSEGEK